MSGRAGTNDKGDNAVKLDRTLLVSLLGQLGKDNDHEVLIAAKKVSDLLREHQVQWQDIIEHAGDFRPKTKEKLLKLDGNRNFMKASDDLPQFLELRDAFFNQVLTAKELAKLDYFYELYIGDRTQKKEYF